MENSVELPNGSKLRWRDNASGGKTYYTAEDGAEILVWNTRLVDTSTLLAAMVNEDRLARKNDYDRRLKREWALND